MSRRFTCISVRRLGLATCGGGGHGSGPDSEQAGFDGEERAATAALEAAINAYVARTNAEPKPFVWTKSADAILASVESFCQRTSDSDQ